MKIRPLAEELGADSEAMFEEHGTHSGQISDREEKKHFGHDPLLKDELDELSMDYANVAVLAMALAGYRPRVVMASLWASGFMIGAEWKERQLRDEEKLRDDYRDEREP